VPSLTPGIWTTDRSGADGYNSGHPSLGDAAGDYCNSFGGTSASCPGVAGVAALVLALNPDMRWQEVKELLRSACDPIGEAPGEYDDQGHSAHFGYGRVNARRAVELAGGV
jgi:subtilisin family serine protease